MKQFLQKILKDFQSNNKQTETIKMMQSTELAASVIFLEMAAMDNDLADIEIVEITEILRTQYNLTDSEVSELLKNAEEARKSAIDIYQFTRSINESCSQQEKLLLMEQIWRIIYADGRLDKHEDHLVHKLANLLHIDHKNMIAAKLKARSDI
ncbi:TerB family tellurite resistance protein [bacterium]|nr:TerB family tellurite resistance protein [bacterium]